MTRLVREASAEATLKLSLKGGVRIFQTEKGGRTGQEVGTIWIVWETACSSQLETASLRQKRMVKGRSGGTKDVSPRVSLP